MVTPNGLLENLIASALWALVGVSHTGLRRRRSRRQPLEERIRIDSELKTAIDKALDQVSGLNPDADVRAFLESPLTASVLRQLYAIELSGADLHVRREAGQLFERGLARHLNMRVADVRDKAIALFEALQLGTQAALAQAIDRGALSAHELASIDRQHRIMHELAAIRQAIEVLNPTARLEIAEIKAFSDAYRTQVKTRHRYITPPNLDSARKVPLDQLFVAPHLHSIDEAKASQRHEDETLSIADMLVDLHRGVVLGHPGGGKSTLSQKIAYDLACQRLDAVGGRATFPTLVVLRDYGAEKKLRPGSILDFIKQNARSLYQMDIPPRAFEYLLATGQIVVIFDGLDELLDTTYRREVTADVEVFCSMYPTCPVLVTSREVGYEQAPLGEEFVVYRIAPFDEDQVAEYASKWFALEETLSPQAQSVKANGFVEESSAVADLRSNPLMLALMCNIYRGESYIPRNRPDVYEKCALMLFERWDRSRGIRVDLPFEAHIDTAVKHLAHWIYVDESLQSGVPKSLLTTETARYLLGARYEDAEEARRAAETFVEFCHGRAWVLTDTGVTAAGEPLYQFTHRTFLEYFSAAHLARVHHTPQALAKVLRPRIALREWDVVAQLAFQILDKGADGAASWMLNDLVRYSNASKQGWRSNNTLTFASTTLQFLVPQPAITRRVAAAVVDRTMSNIQASSRESRPVVTFSGLPEILAAAVENRAIVTECVKAGLISDVEARNPGQRLRTLDLVARLDLPLRFGERHAFPGKLHEYWKRVSDSLVVELRPIFLEEAHLSPQAALLCLWEGLMSIDDALAVGGSWIAFVEYQHSFAAAGRIPWAIATVNQWLRDVAPQPIERLDHLGIYLAAHPPPFAPRKQVRGTLHVLWPRYVLDVVDSEHRRDLSPAGWFAVWTTIAIQIELIDSAGSTQGRRAAELIEALELGHGALSPIAPMLLPRFDSSAPGLGPNAIGRFFRDLGVEELVNDWISGEVNLLQ
jgi:hypothetical protein